MVMGTLLFLSICLGVQQRSNLDDFLKQRGYHLTPAGTAVYEGYVTPEQRDAFIAELRRHPEIRKIAEVGFNAGHTSEMFLEYAKESKVVSFDINAHQYTNAGVEYISAQYKDRFSFVEGDSRIAVVDYFKAHPEEKFDLIYIDGCHLFGACLDDIFNFKRLAHKNSILWVDDVNCLDVKRAVEFARKLRIITVVKSARSQDDIGIREWVEARYIF
jgi:predicted O-methyltransferase YrrM